MPLKIGIAMLHIVLTNVKFVFLKLRFLRRYLVQANA